jgi:hypothetical protein
MAIPAKLQSRSNRAQSYLFAVRLSLCSFSNAAKTLCTETTIDLFRTFRCVYRPGDFATHTMVPAVGLHTIDTVV